MAGNEAPTVEDLRVLERLWRLALSTPALYMVIGAVVGRQAFVHRARSGFWPLDEAGYRWTLAGTAALALALTVSVLWLRARRAASVRWAAYRTRTIAMLALCDLIAFAGLVLYLLQGDAVAQAALAVWAWAAYALSRPAWPARVCGDAP
jgi:hypothetical protein